MLLPKIDTAKMVDAVTPDVSGELAIAFKVKRDTDGLLGTLEPLNYLRTRFPCEIYLLLRHNISMLTTRMVVASRF